MNIIEQLQFIKAISSWEIEATSFRMPGECAYQYTMKRLRQISQGKTLIYAYDLFIIFNSQHSQKQNSK